MKQVIDTMRGCDNAAELGKELSLTAKDYGSHVVYVKLPDGSTVFGYDVEEETLSDGSKVYNLLLKGD